MDFDCLIYCKNTTASIELRAVLMPADQSHALQQISLFNVHRVVRMPLRTSLPPQRLLKPYLGDDHAPLTGFLLFLLALFCENALYLLLCSYSCL